MRNDLIGVPRDVTSRMRNEASQRGSAQAAEVRKNAFFNAIHAPFRLLDSMMAARKAAYNDQLSPAQEGVTPYDLDNPYNSEAKEAEGFGFTALDQVDRESNRFASAAAKLIDIFSKGECSVDAFEQGMGVVLHKGAEIPVQAERTLQKRYLSSDFSASMSDWQALSKLEVLTQARIFMAVLKDHFTDSRYILGPNDWLVMTDEKKLNQTDEEKALKNKYQASYTGFKRIFMEALQAYEEGSAQGQAIVSLDAFLDKIGTNADFKAYLQQVCDYRMKAWSLSELSAPVVSQQVRDWSSIEAYLQRNFDGVPSEYLSQMMIPGLQAAEWPLRSEGGQQALASGPPAQAVLGRFGALSSLGDLLRPVSDAKKTQEAVFLEEQRDVQRIKGSQPQKIALNNAAFQWEVQQFLIKNAALAKAIGLVDASAEDDDVIIEHQVLARGIIDDLTSLHSRVLDNRSVLTQLGVAYHQSASLEAKGAYFRCMAELVKQDPASFNTQVDVGSDMKLSLIMLLGEANKWDLLRLVLRYREPTTADNQRITSDLERYVDAKSANLSSLWRRPLTNVRYLNAERFPQLVSLAEVLADPARSDEVLGVMQGVMRRVTGVDAEGAQGNRVFLVLLSLKALVGSPDFTGICTQWMNDHPALVAAQDLSSSTHSDWSNASCVSTPSTHGGVNLTDVESAKRLGSRGRDADDSLRYPLLSGSDTKEIHKRVENGFLRLGNS